MQRIIKNKKGVSPLIATILLIAFAVALGAVIMSWGRNISFPVKEQVNENCVKVSIAIEKINNIPQVFYGGTEKNGFVKFTIENDGEKDIEGIIIWIIGEKNTSTIDIGQSSIKVGYPLIKRASYDFNKYGKIKKIKFIPKINVLGAIMVCARNSLGEEEISPIN